MSSFPITETAENLWAETCNILAGASKTDGVCTQGHQLVAIVMPAAWTAAALGFDCSLDGVNWFTTLDNNAALIQIKGAAAQFISVPLSQWVVTPYIRLKSITLGGDVAVVQVAAATLTLLFRRVQGGQ